MTLQGDRIKALREARGYTPDTLAKMVGVSEQQIIRWEAAPSDPASSFVIRLAEVLGVSTDYLLGLVEQPLAVHITEAEQQLIRAYREGKLVEMIRRHIERQKPALQAVNARNYLYECTQCHTTLEAGAIEGTPRCVMCGAVMQLVGGAVPDSQIKRQNARRLEQIKKPRPGRKA